MSHKNHKCKFKNNFKNSKNKQNSTKEFNFILEPINLMRGYLLESKN